VDDTTLQVGNVTFYHRSAVGDLVSPLPTDSTDQAIRWWIRRVGMGHP
jgi:hypothetical protein